MSHTIEVFVVDGALQYIHNETGKPAKPGKHVPLKPKEKVKWHSNNGNITIHFNAGSNGDPSPFKSGNTDLPVNAPSTSTTMETINLGNSNSDGTNPTFKYDVIVQDASGPVEDDPDIVMDLTGGGPKTKPTKKSAAKPAKKKAKKK